MKKKLILPNIFPAEKQKFIHACQILMKEIFAHGEQKELKDISLLLLLLIAEAQKMFISGVSVKKWFVKGYKFALKNSQQKLVSSNQPSIYPSTPNGILCIAQKFQFKHTF